MRPEKSWDGDTPFSESPFRAVPSVCGGFPIKKITCNLVKAFV